MRSFVPPLAQSLRERARGCGRVHAGNGEMKIQRATQPSGFRGVELEIGMAVGRGGICKDLGRPILLSINLWGLDQ